MIKLFAALFMLIDHVGLILFPNNVYLRLIGRISMPLFAYCIARGFYYSEQKGTTLKYARNLFVFAVVSQIPFTILSFWVIGSFSFNIGFTWLLSLLLLKALVTEKRPVYLGLMCLLIFSISILVPINFGLYGLLCPIVFYLYMFATNKPQYAFMGFTLLYALYVVLEGNVIQAFSLIAFPILLFAIKLDNTVAFSRRFYYWFYPLHISVLLLLRFVFTRHTA